MVSSLEALSPHMSKSSLQTLPTVLVSKAEAEETTTSISGALSFTLPA